jgi:hypothetical protein
MRRPLRAENCQGNDGIFVSPALVVNHDKEELITCVQEE